MAGGAIKYPCDTCKLLSEWTLDHSSGLVVRKPEACGLCDRRTEWEDQFREDIAPQTEKCPIMNAACFKHYCMWWEGCTLIDKSRDN